MDIITEQERQRMVMLSAMKFYGPIRQEVVQVRSKSSFLHRCLFPQLNPLMTTKLPVPVILLILYFANVSSSVVANDDIFATPAGTPSMVDRYPTSAAFLAATRSGEIPKMLYHTSGNAGSDFGPPLLNILLKEYGLGTKEYKDYYHTVRLGTIFGFMLQNLTDHELNVEDKMPLVYFHDHQQEVPIGLRDIFNKFAVQYDSALKEYVASVQQKEKQVVEEDRTKVDASVKIKEARQRKLAEITASLSYKQWESASQVQQGEAMISNAQRALDHDDAVKRESGVTDLAARRAAGEQIVAGKTLVETAFGTYKKFGGKALTPGEVVAGPDPAAEYR